MLIYDVLGFQPLHNHIMTSHSHNAPRHSKRKSVSADVNAVSTETHDVEAVLKGFCPIEEMPDLECRVLKLYIIAGYTGSHKTQSCGV